MQAAIEAAFTKRARDVAVLYQKQAGLIDVAAKETSRYQRHCHGLGRRELDLRVIAVFDGFEKVVAQTVDGHNGILHFGLLVAELVARNQETISYFDR